MSVLKVLTTEQAKLLNVMVWVILYWQFSSLFPISLKQIHIISREINNLSTWLSRLLATITHQTFPFPGKWSAGYFWHLLEKVTMPQEVCPTKLQMCVLGTYVATRHSSSPQQVRTSQLTAEIRIEQERQSYASRRSKGYCHGLYSGIYLSILLCHAVLVHMCTYAHTCVHIWGRTSLLVRT